MIENARAAQEFIKDIAVDDFLADRTLIYAATRAVEIVGEAAYQVDPAVQAKIPSVPWRDAIAMRHRLVHGYRKTDARIIFDTVRNQFPGLIAELERLLKEGRQS